MQIENLTGQNVSDIEKKLKDLQQENPFIKHEVFPMKALEEKTKSDNERIQELSDKLDMVINKLNHIFDGHVLINGEFKKIT